MRKYILSLLLTAGILSGVFAADKSWNAVATEMKGIIDDAFSLYQNQKADAAYERVNDAYFGHYEVDGFERSTQSRIRLRSKALLKACVPCLRHCV